MEGFILTPGHVLARDCFVHIYALVHFTDTSNLSSWNLLFAFIALGASLLPSGFVVYPHDNICHNNNPFLALTEIYYYSPTILQP